MLPCVLRLLGGFPSRPGSKIEEKTSKVKHCNPKTPENLCLLVYVCLTPWTDLKKNFFWKIDPLWNRRQCYRIDSKLVPREILTCWSGIWRQKPSIPPPRPQNWEKRYLKKIVFNPFAGLGPINFPLTLWEIPGKFPEDFLKTWPVQRIWRSW